MNGSRLYMNNNSSIFGNTSRGGVFGAGGLFAKNSLIYMHGATQISHNTNMNTEGGGGVTLHNSTLNMFGIPPPSPPVPGAPFLLLRFNHTNNPFGGGLWIEHSSELNITNGLIGGHPGNSPDYPNTTTVTDIADGGFSTLYIAPGSPPSVARRFLNAAGTPPYVLLNSQNTFIQVINL